MSPVLSPSHPDNASPGHLVLTSPRCRQSPASSTGGADIDRAEVARKANEREEKAEARRVKAEAAKAQKLAAWEAEKARRRAERERLSRERQAAKRAGKKVKADPGHGDFLYGDKSKALDPQARREYKAAKIKRQTERRAEARAEARKAEEAKVAGLMPIEVTLAYLELRGAPRSKSAISKAVNLGKLACVRSGRRYYFDPGELGRWVVASEAAAKANRAKAGERMKEMARMRRAS